MNCRMVREQLTATESALRARLDEHLADCESCARYAERLDQARMHFREHLTEVEPDGAFAARVVTRLDAPGDVLGWAAMRLLPGTLALLLVLVVLVFATTGLPSMPVTEAPTDDLLAWLTVNGS